MVPIPATWKRPYDRPWIVSLESDSAELRQVKQRLDTSLGCSWSTIITQVGLNFETACGSQF